LRRQAQRDTAAFRVVAGDGGARFHRCRDQALVDDFERNHMRRLRERGVGRRDIAVAHLGGDVASRGIPDQRRIGCRGLRQTDHDGKLVIVHQHRFQRVLRLVERFGEYRDHRLTHEAHAFDCQRGAERRGAGGAVGACEDRRERDRLYAVGDEIGAGHHGEHAGHRRGRGGVDRDDARMRDRGAQEAEMNLPGHRGVVGVMALAGQQAGILDPLDFASAAETPDRRIVQHCCSFGYCFG
jgi:hypothetical protein